MTSLAQYYYLAAAEPAAYAAAAAAAAHLHFGFCNAVVAAAAAAAEVYSHAGDTAGARVRRPDARAHQYSASHNALKHPYVPR